MSTLLVERRCFPSLSSRRLSRHSELNKADAEQLSHIALKTQESTIMDTNTLLIILVVIFLFGGFGFYGRGRWF
jgi:hypothetical protein